MSRSYGRGPSASSTRSPTPRSPWSGSRGVSQVADGVQSSRGPGQSLLEPELRQLRHHRVDPRVIAAKETIVVDPAGIRVLHLLNVLEITPVGSLQILDLLRHRGLRAEV